MYIKNRIQSGTLLFLIFSILFIKCTYDTVEPSSGAYTVTLRWSKAYADETPEKVRTGFLWSMSQLGANLPSSSIDKGLYFSDNNKLNIDFSKLGFDAIALESLKIICDRIKKSGEYQSKGSVDIGRFLMLTIYSANHYYRITNAALSIDAFKIKFPHVSPGVFAITNSGISSGHRKIILENNSQINGSSCFITEEGTGNITDSTFVVTEYETINMMPNGQLRYLIYGEDGTLRNAADPALSPSGKSGKCMWCHESKAQPLLTMNVDVNNYMPTADFLTRINESNEMLKSYRSFQSKAIDWSKPQDHTLSELLYISFMEPNAERIAAEWGTDVATVNQILSGYPTHVYSEFPFLGNLYDRSTIDSLAPFDVERVPESAREGSVYEPDFF